MGALIASCLTAGSWTQFVASLRAIQNEFRLALLHGPFDFNPFEASSLSSSLTSGSNSSYCMGDVTLLSDIAELLQLHDGWSFRSSLSRRLLETSRCKEGAQRERAQISAFVSSRQRFSVGFMACRELLVDLGVAQRSPVLRRSECTVASDGASTKK